MADDNNARYRSIDPPRAPEPAAANDPLAELARLIGQTDPFAASPRDNRASISRDTSFRGPPQSPASDLAARLASATGYQYGARTTPQYGADSQVDAETQASYGATPAPHHSVDPAPHDSPEPAPGDSSERTEAHYADDPRADWPGSPSDPLAPLPPLPTMPPPAPKLSAPDDFDIRAYPDPRVRMEQAGFYTRRSSPDPSALESELSGLTRQTVYPEEPDSGPMPSPHADEFYNDASPANRRRGLMTVAAVLALAVVGTAAAFGYRSLVTGGGPSAPPPVIKASGEPSKVAPPAAQPDPSAGKFSYDRFGDRGKDEQVVAREEKPVDAKDLARSVVPRTVLPGAPTASSTPNVVAPSALGEPRRVRTQQIRPDQPEPSITPQTVASAPMAIAPSADTASASAPGSRPAANPVPQPRPQPRVAARPTQPTPPAGNAPLSLAPDSGAAPPPAANTAPPPRAAAPPRPAPVVASAGGGFVVQVSSRRSEADAEAAYRNLQGKYTSVLNGQPHAVKRADLGAKGVFYRAVVGPYGTRDQAIQLCSSLKAAGGDCVVVAN
jgi:hypothetical protein